MLTVEYAAFLQMHLNYFFKRNSKILDKEIKMFTSTCLDKCVATYIIKLITCHIQPLNPFIYSFKINHTNHIRHF